MKKLLVLSVFLAVVACGGVRDGFRSRGHEFEEVEEQTKAHERFETEYSQDNRRLFDESSREEARSNTQTNRRLFDEQPQEVEAPREVIVVNDRPTTSIKNGVYVESDAPVVRTTDEQMYRDTIFTPRQDHGYTVNTSAQSKDVWQDDVTPDVYSIVATRATNKMLDESSKIYDRIPAPTLYVKNANKLTEDLPSGVYMANQTTKNIIKGSRAFVLVNNIHDAEYVLETYIERLNVDGYSSPILKYRSVLSDARGNKIQEWNESIQQIVNDDRSWW